MDRRDVLIVLSEIIAYKDRFVLLRQFVDTVDEVASALYHTLVDKLLERLLLTAYIVVVQELIPETAVDKVTGGMLSTAYIQVDMTPVFVGILADELLVVMRVHIAEVVSRRTGEARHSVELQREHCLVVYCRAIDNGT